MKNNIYPIGKLEIPKKITEILIEESIQKIENLPHLLKKTAKKIGKKNLQNTYREDGWTIEQIIHHIADSHINMYCRFKLALTEDMPTIKPYDENLWAEMTDITVSIKTSIQIIEGIHKRLTVILQNMQTEDFERKLYHPERQTEISLKEMVYMYAWHGNHHVAQIEVALEN